MIFKDDNNDENINNLFQEEKYEPLYLNLKWTKERLIDILDKRVDYLVKQRYTKQRVTYKDILPRKIAGVPAVNYIITRTLMRPRDIILFINYCIALAANKSAITLHMVIQAEGEYSRTRLRSLAEEWYADYPNLMKFTELLKGRIPSFALEDFGEKEIADFALEVAVNNSCQSDDLFKAAQLLADDLIKTSDFMKIIAQIFYRVGLLGLKVERYEPILWSTEGRPNVSSAQIQPSTKATVHPCFWRILGIKTNLQ